MIHVLKKQKHPPTPPGTHHPELSSRVFSDVKLAFLLGTYTFEADTYAVLWLMRIRFCKFFRITWTIKQHRYIKLVHVLLYNILGRYFGMILRYFFG